MRARTILASLVGVALVMGMTVAVAFAGWKSSGEGGCDNFFDGLNAAQAGDVLTPMSSGVNTNGAIISKTLLIQGGWKPGAGSCSSNRTSNYTSRAAMLAAGFIYNSAERTELFGDFDHSTLRLDLTSGQTVALQNLQVNSSFANQNGYALSGTLNGGARLRLENMNFDNNQAGVNNTGGAIYLEVRGGSQVVIVESIFNLNNAISGGALEIRLFDNSSLLIEDSTFTNNNALTGNGGALRVVINSGSVTLRGNTFTNNSSTNGSGGAVAIERAAGATGSAFWAAAGNSFSSNSAANAGTANIFSTVAQLTPRIYLPLLRQPATSSFNVRISEITLSDEQYRATFTATGYTPVLPGRHIHFFFNTVPPTQAGMPGAGPWRIYGSTAPFTGYGIANRPAGATHLCALVANPDHSVIQGTGNCVALP